MIRLEEITPENWRLGLKVAKAQEHYVSDTNRMLARAYAYRNHRSQAFVVYSDELPVGMAMYYDCEELEAYDLSQLFIDERYQGRGYGYQAAMELIARMRADGRYRKAVLCYIEGNEAAARLYEKIGFVHTGEADGDEIIMQLAL